MSVNKLSLKNFNIQSFAGISKGNPIIISFPDGHRFLKAEGDQGTNKTSTIEALKTLLGSNMIANAVNKDDDDKKGIGRFIGKDGLLYQVRMTKTTFVLENIVTDENGDPVLDDKGKERTREEKKPMTLIRKLIGPLGISPMELKQKNTAEQIEWLQSHYSDGAEDFKTKETQIKQKAATAYKKRTEVNRDIKRINSVLDANDFFKRKDFWSNEFAIISNEADVTNKLSEKKESAEQYIREEEKLKNIKVQEQNVQTEITAIEAEIQRLKNALEQKKNEATELNNKIDVANNFLLENKEVSEEYEAVNTEFLKIQELKISKAGYDTMLMSEKELETLTKQKETLTSEYEAANTELVEYIKSFTPDILGFEVKIATDENTEEGLFYTGKSIDQLCESELWEMCLLVWAAFDVRIVFAENLNSLGSNAIERLNWFVDNGGYVFATEMDRAEKNIKISVNTKIN